MQKYAFFLYLARGLTIFFKIVCKEAEWIPNNGCARAAIARHKKGPLKANGEVHDGLKTMMAEPHLAYAGRIMLT